MKKFVKLFTTFLAVLSVVVLAACGGKEPTKYTAQEMADAVVFDYEEKAVTFTIEVPKTVERTLEGSDEVQTENITWTSDDSRVIVKDYLVSFKFDENNLKPAKIKANVKVGEETGTSTFQFQIKKESSYEEFRDLSRGDGVSISGYIVSKGEFVPAETKPDKNDGKASLVLLDASKTHYFYANRASIAPSVYENLKVGQYIGLTGEKDVYSKQDQVNNAKVVKLPGDEATAGEPIAITEQSILTEGKVNWDFVADNAYAPAKATLFVTSEAEDYKGQGRKALLDAKLDSATGKVDFTLCNNDYLFNFNYDDRNQNSQALKDLISKLTGLKPGDTVEVEGYIARYNDGINFNVNDASKITVKSSNPDFIALAKTEENIVKAIKDAKLGTDTEVVFTLEEGVTAEYTLDTDTSVFKIEGNKLVVKPTSKETKVTLNVKLSKGSSTSSFDVELKAQLSIEMPETIIQTIKGVNNNEPDSEGNIPYIYMTTDGSNNAKHLGLDEKIWSVTSQEQYVGGKGVCISDKGQLRLYSDRDGQKGNSITLTSTNIEFQYVRLTVKNDSKKFAETFKVNDIIVDNVVEGQIIVKLPAKTKTLTIHNNLAKSGVQVRIDSIELA